MHITKTKSKHRNHKQWMVNKIMNRQQQNHGNHKPLDIYSIYPLYQRLQHSEHEQLNRMKDKIYQKMYIHMIQMHAIINKKEVTAGNRIKIGPRRKKTCLRGVLQCEFLNSLLSYRDQIENWNFTWIMSTYDTFQNANNKGADQTARMRRLVCAFVVHKPPKTGFLALRHNLHSGYLIKYLTWVLCQLVCGLAWGGTSRAGDFKCTEVWPSTAPIIIR